jgi:hypothetical protein
MRHRRAAENAIPQQRRLWVFGKNLANTQVEGQEGLMRFAV